MMGTQNLNKSHKPMFNMENHIQIFFLISHFLDSCDQTKPYDCALWMGLNDLEEEGHYRWDSSNFTMTFSNWHQSQPDGSNKKNCIDMLQNGEWNDRKCWYNNSFVCEMV